MPMHWDWDLHHDHYLHWGRTWNWPWDSHNYGYNWKCPTRRRYWDGFDVCTRDWHLHHNEESWCHASCLAGRVIIETGEEADTNGKGTFKVVIDVHHFRIDELVVKVKNNDMVVLEGKQKDDRADKGTLCITREFVRKYKLPRNYDATLAKATLSTDGIMMIIVPAPPPLNDVEREVEIVPTGAYFGTGNSTSNNNAKAIENGKDGDEKGVEQAEGENEEK